MVILWYFDGIPMTPLWDFHDVSLIFLRGSCRLSMVFPRKSYGIPTGCLLHFHEVSMESLWHFYGIPVGFLSVSHRVSMVLARVFVSEFLGFMVLGFLKCSLFPNFKMPF